MSPKILGTTRLLLKNRSKNSISFELYRSINGIRKIWCELNCNNNRRTTKKTRVYCRNREIKHLFRLKINNNIFKTNVFLLSRCNKTVKNRSLVRSFVRFLFFYFARSFSMSRCSMSLPFDYKGRCMNSVAHKNT